MARDQTPTKQQVLETVASKLPSSLHDRLWDEITSRIISGAWPPGSRIPFEHELTAEYGCSRATMNKVLTRLAHAGLIERRRKAGSFVTRPHTQSAVLQISDIGMEVSSLGLSYEFRLLTQIQRSYEKSDARRISLQRMAPILHLTCCHFAGHRPFCFEDRLINLHAVPEAAYEDFAATPPGSWLSQRVPWTSAEHTIGAVGADSQVSAVLRLELQSPCLTIDRRTWNTEQPVTSVTLTYPAGAHHLVARFQPSSAER